MKFLSVVLLATLATTCLAATIKHKPDSEKQQEAQPTDAEATPKLLPKNQHKDLVSSEDLSKETPISKEAQASQEETVKESIKKLKNSMLELLPVPQENNLKDLELPLEEVTKQTPSAALPPATTTSEEKLANTIKKLEESVKDILKKVIDSVKNILPPVSSP